MIDRIKRIKRLRNRRKSGYVFAPYIMMEITPVIISGDFTPKSVLRSRYALSSPNSNYLSVTI